MNGKTIVVLGGGVGGIVVANELRRMLSHEHNIVLVERNAQHAFAPSFLWLMTGDRKADQITRPVRSLVRQGVDILYAEATGIDISQRRIATTARTLAYDYLVVALGAELAPEMIPGLSETAFSFYTFEKTKLLHQALAGFSGGTIALVVAALPYKCPGAPHEAAMLLADYYRGRGIRDKVDIHLYTPEPQPMPVAGPQLGEAVQQLLSSKGITFYSRHKLVTVDAHRRTLSFEGNHSTQFDLLVAIPPHRAPRVVRESGLTNEAGWIPVDRASLKTTHDNVYAIGDVASISIPGRWNSNVPMMLPKAGVFAHTQAEIVAQRIADEIGGRKPTSEFCGPGYCMLEAGEGVAGFAYGDFFAEPSPRIELRNIGRAWHLGKVLFEQWWLSPFGMRKTLLHSMLSSGAKAFRIPISL